MKYPLNDEQAISWHQLQDFLLQTKTTRLEGPFWTWRGENQVLGVSIYLEAQGIGQHLEIEEEWLDDLNLAALHSSATRERS